MSSQHNPGCFGAIHFFQVIFQPHVLPGGWSVIMFRTHHDKMDASIVETVPVKKYQQDSHEKKRLMTKAHVNAHEARTRKK